MHDHFSFAKLRDLSQIASKVVDTGVWVKELRVDPLNMITCLKTFNRLSLVSHQFKDEVEDAFYKNARVCIEVVEKPGWLDEKGLHETDEIDTSPDAVIKVLNHVCEQFHHITLRRLRKPHPFHRLGFLSVMHSVISQTVRFERNGAKHEHEAKWFIDVHGEKFVHQIQNRAADLMDVICGRLEDVAQKAWRRRTFNILVLHDIMSLMLDPNNGDMVMFAPQPTSGLADHHFYATNQTYQNINDVWD